MATTVTLKPNAIDISGSTSGTTTLQATAVAGTTTITLPSATDTLVGKATTDTLTNKTLTAPVISTISNTGTLTLPTSTDTLVGRATTDTLTNKTLTTPVISSLSSASATALTLQSAGTTAITVDTSQNLLVGTSTVAGSSQGLNIGTPNAGSTSTPIALQNRSTANNSGVQISFRGLTSTGAESDYGYITMVANDTTAKNSYMSFTTTSGGTPSEHMRINSAGYLKASNTGTYQSSTSSNHELRTSNGGDFSTYITNSNASTPYGLEIQFTAAAPNNTSQSFCLAEDTANLRFVLMANGGIKNYSANNVNLSDRREKTNFAPAKSYLNTICSIPVQTFNYIDQNLAEDDGLTLGVVAQDVQSIAPELVHETDWGTKEDPKMRLSIYQTDLQYALMKSIQELKAINDTQAETINALTARIVALEAK